MKQNAASVDGAELKDACIVLTEDASDSGYGMQCTAELQQNGYPHAIVKLYLPDDAQHYYGERLLCSGRITASDLSQDEYAYGNGCVGTLKATQISACAPSDVLQTVAWVRRCALQSLDAALADIAQADSATILKALVCGYRVELKQSSLYAAYQTCGLAHLVAVSGAHLVIVTGLFALLLRKAKIPRRLSIFILIGLMAAYLVLAGSPISALRATIMSSVGILAVLGKRRPSSLNALGIGIIAIVALQPAASIAVSFCLSALSTAGIVIFAPLIISWFNALPIALPRFAVDALSLTAASSLLSQLYAASIFGIVPLVAPLANMVVAPLFAPVCGLGLISVLAAAAHLPGSGVLVFAAQALCGAMNACVEILAQLPGAAVPFYIDTAPALIISASAACALWAAWPRLSRLALPALVAIVLTAIGWFVPHAQDSIIMLDVGQGDAFVLQSGGKCMLIDTGNHDSDLLKGLARNGITHLDALAITHADDDHCGSIDALAKAVSVDTVFVADGTQNAGDAKNADLMKDLESLNAPICPLQLGNSIAFGTFRATVVWPRSSAQESGNEASLCLLVEYDYDADGTADSTALFTGDAEKEQLHEIVQQTPLGHIDILKVGHHGSKNAFTEEDLQALSPDIALISVGQNNRYGHPHSSILQALESCDCAIVRTDEQGEATCIFTPQQIQVI